MITITARVTGAQVAEDVMGDDEEFAYFLNHLSDNLTPGEIDRMVEYIPYGKSEEIAQTLRAIAKAIEEAD